MAEGFWEGWSRYLFIWFGFVFTVFGAAVGLFLAREYWWISALIVLAIFAASGFFAFQRHRELRQAEGRHDEERRRLNQEMRTVGDQLREAERKLNEVPLTLLARLESVIAAHSFGELSRLLIAQAEFIGRMKRFSQASTKPINLRTFTRQSGNLYVVAKAVPEALEHLRVGDTFLLVKASPDGLETPCARLAVHQPPLAGKDVVMFRIESFLSDEMGHIDSLTRSGDIQGIKGYGVRFQGNVERYRDLDLENLNEILAQLAQDVSRSREV